MLIGSLVFVTLIFYWWPKKKNPLHQVWRTSLSGHTLLSIGITSFVHRGSLIFNFLDLTRCCDQKNPHSVLMSNSITVSHWPAFSSCWEHHADTKHWMFWNIELSQSFGLQSAASGSAASSSAGPIMKQIYFDSASNVPWSINPVSPLLSCQAGALTGRHKAPLALVIFEGSLSD